MSQALRFRRACVSVRESGDPNDMAKLFDTLTAKGRASISEGVEVVDEEQTLALSAVAEWFVARIEQTGD